MAESVIQNVQKGLERGYKTPRGSTKKEEKGQWFIVTVPFEAAYAQQTFVRAVRAKDVNEARQVGHKFIYERLLPQPREFYEKDLPTFQTFLNYFGPQKHYAASPGEYRQVSEFSAIQDAIQQTEATDLEDWCAQLEEQLVAESEEMEWTRIEFPSEQQPSQEFDE